MRKRIELIGDLLGGGAVHTGGGWRWTYNGLRYEVGERDTIGAIAKRYLHSVDRARDILALQPAGLRLRGIRPGDELIMPDAAVRTARQLGLILEDEIPHIGRPILPGEMKGPSDLGGLSDALDAWRNGHELQEKINGIVFTLAATVEQDQATRKGIDNATLGSWNMFAHDWERFRTQEPSPITNVWLPAGVGGVLYLKDLLDRYDAMKTQWAPQADAWTKKIKTLAGGLIGPVPPAVPGDPDAPPDTPSGGATPWTAITWVAAAAIVGVVGWTVSPALRVGLKRWVR